MIPILTASETREADRRATRIGLPGLVLMENAARGCYTALRAMLGDEESPTGPIVVLCGMGNNGGDGAAIVRLALNDGLNAMCVLVGDRTNASAELRAQLRVLDSVWPASVVEFATFRRRHVVPGVTLDALLGTGSRGAPRGQYLSAVRWINAHGGRVVSIDLPTGVDADLGSIPGAAVKAERTFTVGTLKPGLLVGKGPIHAGFVETVDLGVPRPLYARTKTWLLDRAVAGAFIDPIPLDRHKYDRGKVLVVGSGAGMAGAGMLAAHAALRAGAGLSVLAMPFVSLSASPHRLPPEVMTREVGQSTVTAEALQNLLASGEQFNAIAIGPGLGRTRDTSDAVRYLLSTADVPLVFDADALFPFNGSPATLARRRAPLVITPHHGEMARLVGINRADVSSDPCGVAREVAKASASTVVLKGAPTIIAVPDGRVWINGAGNPGMATAGVGDVLCGVVAAYLCNHENVLDRVLSAVFLHSYAADRVAARRGPYGMTAGDLIDELPDAASNLATGS